MEHKIFHTTQEILSKSNHFKNRLFCPYQPWNRCSLLCGAAQRIQRFVQTRLLRANEIEQHCFGHKHPRFFNFKWIFFRLKKPESQIFENTANLFYLNFISKKNNKKQENLLGSLSRAGHYQKEYLVPMQILIFFFFQKQYLLPMGILILFSKKVPPTNEDFDFFFPKYPRF